MKRKVNFSLSSWLKALWGKLSRFIKRLIYPKQGKRNVTAPVTDFDSPLTGVSQFRHPEGLTVQELMAKVQWQLPKQQTKTVSNVKEQINWD